MNGKFGLIASVAAGVAAIGGLMYISLAPVDGPDDASGPSTDAKASQLREPPSAAKRSKIKSSDNIKSTKKSPAAKKPRKPRMQVPDDWFDKLPAADKAMAKRIQDAQDADDCEATLAAAEAALDSNNAEVRQAAVDALSLQGESAMPLLLKFALDKSSDVADSAYRAWDDAVDTIDGDAQKLTAVKAAIEVLDNKEHIASAVGKIEMFDQPKSIRELAKLAGGNGRAAEAARESYENVVGEPFKNWAEAELKAIVIERDNAEE